MRRMIGPFTGDPRSAWKRSGLSILRCFLLLMFLASFLGPLPTVRAQSQIPFSKVQGVLAAMTAEERVGQLFLVTFQGTNTEPDSQIYDLIANHHVGGVVLLAGNDNFVAAPDTVPSAHQLVNSLQSIEAQVATSTPVPNSNINNENKIYVPLFIG